MKLDIENKIMIPFIILVIISILAVGFVSYNGSYRLFLDNRLTEMAKDLDDIARIIGMQETDLPPDQLIAEIRKIKQIKLVIFDKSGKILVNDYESALNQDYFPALQQADKWGSNFRQVRLNVKGDNSLFLFKPLNPSGWYLGTATVLNSVSSSLLEIQKYTIFVAIIFAIIAVELTIAIAFNLSKPIKKFAETCNKISTGDFSKKLNFKRRDEIGVLADAFDNMIDKIVASTQELKELKEINEDILRSTTTGIITIGDNGNIISINRAAENIIRDDKEVNEVIFERIIKLSQDALRTGEQVSQLLKFTTDNGENKVLEVNTSLLANQQGTVNGALSSFNDITRRKEIEEKMEQIEKLVSLGQLAAGLAHEIRNPLAGMKTSSQLLIKRLQDNEAATVFLQKIVVEIDRINKLVSDILNFAKPKEPVLELVDITSLIRETVALMGEYLSRAEVKVRDELSVQQAFCKIDKDQFKQILVNLIINSLNAMENGGELLLEGGRLEQEPNFVFSLTDTGKGIAPDNMERIFDPFFTTNHEGTGLGLSVVKRLVIQNNGEIRVTSELGKGTKFCIELPLVKELS